MITKHAKIEEVEFYEDATRFGVLKVNDEAKTFRAIGEVYRPEVGQEVVVSGEFHDHELFGPCFVIRTVTTSEEDPSLVGVLPLESRIKIRGRDLVHDLDIPDREFLALMEARDVAPDKRIELLALRVADRQSSSDEALRMHLVQTLGVSSAQAQLVLTSMYRDGRLVLTRSNTVTSKRVKERADSWLKRIPEDLDLRTCDEAQWHSVLRTDGAVDPDLTDQETNAVYVAINSGASVIDVKDPERAAMIRDSISSAARVLEGAEIDHVVICGDIDLVTPDDEEVGAMIDAGIPHFEVAPVPQDQIREAMYGLARGDGLRFTSLWSESAGERFADGHDGDRTLWACVVDAEDIPDVARRLHAEVGADNCQAISAKGGRIGELMLLKDGEPVLGRYRIGDKVIDGMGDIRVVDGVQDIDVAAQAWAVSLDQARNAARTWSTVVLIVEPGAPMNWRIAYNAMSLAESQVVVVGAMNDLRRLGDKATRPRNEVLYQALCDRKKRKAVETI